MSVIEPVGPRPVEPVDRRLGAPAVRERYLDEQQRDREGRRRRKPREEPAPEPAAEASGGVDVRA
jgi:hypothetical protein